MPDKETGWIFALWKSSKFYLLATNEEITSHEWGSFTPEFYVPIIGNTLRSNEKNQ